MCIQKNKKNLVQSYFNFNLLQGIQTQSKNLFNFYEKKLIFFYFSYLP